MKPAVPASSPRAAWDEVAAVEAAQQGDAVDAPTPTSPEDLPGVLAELDAAAPPPPAPAADLEADGVSGGDSSLESGDASTGTEAASGGAAALSGGGSAPVALDLPQAVYPTGDRPGMVYDPIARKTYLFGGCGYGAGSSSCTSWSSLTWSFDGDTWTVLPLTVRPPARSDAVFVWDAARAQAVLFGGRNGSGALSDTWTFNGTAWTQKSPSTVPSARYSAQATWFPALNNVTLLGGTNGTATFGDQWSWNGANWSSVPGTKPPARSAGALVYAGGVGGNKLVLFGGWDAAATKFSDTWTLTGTTWTQVSALSSPPPMTRMAAAYNPTLDVAVLAGGFGYSGDEASTWMWDGTRWWQGGGGKYPVSVSGAPIAGAAMAVTPTNGQLVMAGGSSVNGAARSASTLTFKYDYLAWGRAASYSLLERSITDRVSELVNPANTNLAVHALDVNLAAPGVPLVLDRYRQSQAGCISNYLPCGWVAPLIDMRLYPLPDGSVVLVGLDGGVWFFDRTGPSTWTAPLGTDLQYTPVSGGATVTRLHAALRYNFDSTNRLTGIVDRNGVGLSVTHTATGQTITDAAGHVVTMAVNATTGQVETYTLPDGRVVHFDPIGGTPDGRAVYTTTPGGSAPWPTVKFYKGTTAGGAGPFDMVIGSSSGREHAYNFGTMGRLLNTRRVLDTVTGNGTVTVYNTAATPGRLKLTDGMAHVTTYIPDLTGPNHTARITVAIDANGHSRVQTFDPTYNPASYHGADTAALTTYTWDANGNPTATTAPSSNGTNTAATATATYPGSGLIYQATSSTDAQGNCAAYQYDTVGNLRHAYTGQAAGCAGATGGNHNETRIQGSGASCGGKLGAVCATVTPQGRTTSYAYNPAGQLSIVTPPAPLGATSYSYDGVGRVLTVTDGKGQLTRFSYDTHDRVTQVLYGGATSCTTTVCIAYVYDHDGNRTGRASTIGTTIWTYDTAGRVVEKILPGYPSVCPERDGIRYSYDAVDNLTDYCDGAGTTNYSYDDANQLVQVGVAGLNCPFTPGDCVTIGYTDVGGAYGDGRPTLITYPTTTGMSTRLTYDAAGNLLSTVTTKGAGTVASHTYTYNRGTNDTALRQTLTTPAAGTVTYSYDQWNQLCSVITGATTPSCGIGSQRWTYDGDGNRVTQTMGSTTTRYAYNGAGQLCNTSTGGSATCSNPSYTYDGNGNQTSPLFVGSGAYNTKNQFASYSTLAGTANLVYADADSTERTQDVGGNTFASSRLGLAHTRTGSTTTWYHRLPSGQLLAQNPGGSGLQWLIPDGLGSIVAVVNNSGATVKTYSYGPWGTVTAGAGAGHSNHQYAGGYYEGSTEQVKFGTRYYQPRLGRFTQLDPLGYGYIYVGNEPIGYVDPSGYIRYNWGNINGSAYFTVTETRDIAATLSDFSNAALFGLGTLACNLVGGLYGPAIL